MKSPRKVSDLLTPTAGNGLLDRRVFLSSALSVLGAAGIPFLIARHAVADTPLAVPESMQSPGTGMTPYGQRSRHESHVLRTIDTLPGTTGSGGSFTPLEHLEGTITPNGLHFERHHNGIPDIDPAGHRLIIHGLVGRALKFDLYNLSRYSTVSRVHFLECSGNSAGNSFPVTPQKTAGELHGLVSCCEWTGIPLAVLLNEAGLKPEARWIVAEGADAAGLTRSIPLTKAMDDAIIALYQNGERLRPENGYPMRLFLPGWEGSANVKWLRRLEVTSRPAMSREETAKYTDLKPDGLAMQFTFPMDVKSVITSPSGGQRMQGAGLYEISGLAWSGQGRIKRVEVSADGGLTWAEAALTEPVLPKAFTRFRIPWRWNGSTAILQSRATDDTLHTQPTRDVLLAKRGASYIYHFNAIQSWEITPQGQVHNVYA